MFIIQYTVQEFFSLYLCFYNQFCLRSSKFLYSILNDKRVKELLKDGKYKQAQTRVKKILNEWL